MGFPHTYIVANQRRAWQHRVALSSKTRYLEAPETLWILAQEIKIEPDELSTLLLAKDMYGNTAWHVAAETGNF